MNGRKIKLANGKYALVDSEDFDYLSQWKWRRDINGYAIRRVRVGTHRNIIRMHRLVANTPKGMYTDHINHNPLDNCRDNLRICSPLQNTRNSRIRKDNTSGFKGIWFNKKTNKWRATIWVNGRKIYNGSHTTKEKAGLAYNELANRYFGEFKELNEVN